MSRACARSRRLTVILLSAASVLGAGCSLQPESQPHDVPEENRPLPGGESVGGGAASGAERIYLLGPGEDQLLRSVPRDAASPVELMQILFRGANEEELRAQYGSAIPAALGLLSARTQGSFLYLDVTDELKTLSGPGLVQALAQIVYTASELEGVESVQLTVSGERLAWPKANLESTTDPLRVYDYPGLIRTAQPAYPSVPGA